MCVCDGLYDYIEKLKSENFSAFEPRRSLAYSYCCSANEKKTHQEYLIESGKWQMSLPILMPYGREGLTHWYRSEFLKNLELDLERENGVPLPNALKAYPGEIWRTELDPCRRRMVYERVRQPARFEHVWRSMLRDERLAFEKEVSFHATRTLRDFSFDEAGRYAAYDSAMDKYVGALGFNFDKKLSTPIR